MRYLFPAILGICGIAILVSLGTWQLRRLAWKEAMLAEIDARITATPVAVPAAPDPEADRYLLVEAEGDLGGEGLMVLASIKQVGAIHRFITTLTTLEGRVLLVDLGYRRIVSADASVPEGAVRLTGNLHWPEEIDSYTPAPDGTLWFARDVPAMAEALGAEPVLIVTRDVTPGSSITPLPVSSAGIPNDHLEYALTWFGLALVWLGMTLFLMWRIKRRTV
ncbi:SURF1 family protein [Vannielia litorea]|uniref:SURF1 family protein n=1 Tax=Vannielia litorea TaxID=1217970 RepID=UPI001C97F28D|nr:SURF1 family protein [Vannielia litorea]MBY6048137.1 SURF1 family protein [Vannielia litorea]MBY6075551.1 SURF1 family protein [Vannielia litorea]